MNQTLPNHYETLGVGISATPDEIKSAFRRLAMQTHPDRNKAPDAKEKFIALREAFEILIDAQKRRVYDNLRKPQYEQPSSSSRTKTSGTSQSTRHESTSARNSNSSTRQRQRPDSTSQESSGRSSGHSSQSARPQPKTREEEWRWYEIWSAEARKKGRETADTDLGDWGKAVEFMLGERAGARVAIAGRGCMSLLGLFMCFMGFGTIIVRGEWGFGAFLALGGIWLTYMFIQEAVAIKEKHLE